MKKNKTLITQRKLLKFGRTKENLGKLRDTKIKLKQN